MHIVWQDQREGNLEIFYARAPGTLTKVGNGLIAFSRRDASRQPQIHTIQPDADKSDLSANERQLTNLGTNMFPAWSEDGARMAFATNRTGTFEIWMMDAAVRTRRRWLLRAEDRHRGSRHPSPGPLVNPSQRPPNGA